MLGVREALAAEPEGQGDASVRDVVGVAEAVGNVGDLAEGGVDVLVGSIEFIGSELVGNDLEEEHDARAGALPQEEQCFLDVALPGVVVDECGELLDVFEALGVLVDEVNDERLGVVGVAGGGAEESDALVLGAMLAYVGAAAVRRLDDSDLAVKAEGDVPFLDVEVSLRVE